MARFNLPIKFFVLNNEGYASIRASQRNYFGKATIGCDGRTGLTVPNISRIAQSYGISRLVMPDNLALRQEVRRFLERPGPGVCDVRVIPDEVRAPRISSRQQEDGTFISTPLEDLWPFLSREEFASNMLVK